VQVRPRELPLARSAGAHVSVVEIALVVCAAGMELESMDSLPLPICRSALCCTPPQVHGMDFQPWNSCAQGNGIFVSACM